MHKFVGKHKIWRENIMLTILALKGVVGEINDKLQWVRLMKGKGNASKKIDECKYAIILGTKFICTTLFLPAPRSIVATSFWGWRREYLV